MTDQSRNLENRDWLIQRLHAELIGPDPCGHKVSVENNETSFSTWEEFRKPKRQMNGEEILWLDSPIKRYGAGVLFPSETNELEQLAEEANSIPEEDLNTDEELDVRIDEKLEGRVDKKGSSLRLRLDSDDEYEVNLSNAHRPSAMSLSFLADLSHDEMHIETYVSFASYELKSVKIGLSGGNKNHSKREIWLRKPSVPTGESDLSVSFRAKELLEAEHPVTCWVPGFENKLEIVIVSRRVSFGTPNERLLTVSMINRQQKGNDRLDKLCFFQCGFRVTSDQKKDWILPYPEIRRKSRNCGDEEEIIRLLYRNRLTFAVGHGCSADWKKGRPQIVGEVQTDCLPTYETPSITPDISDQKGVPIRINMRKLAGLDPKDNGFREIRNLVENYSDWIDELGNFEGRKEINGSMIPVPDDLKNTAEFLIKKCEFCCNRIQKGIDFLMGSKDIHKKAMQAFRLANHAMLISQLRSNREIRNPKLVEGRYTFDKPIQNPDPNTPHKTKGYWRAFQIAFILMCVPGICLPDDPERELVDLIWFPTGGGKTEAYLGLTAFVVFFNRLSGKKTQGADVLMRYTLRLLTAQQFQRASLLFCSMEHLRRQEPWNSILGEPSFSLGLWVGGTATPNKRSDAISILKKLSKNPESENPFVLFKCPWCNARFGSYQIERQGHSPRGAGRNRSQVLGYEYFRSPGKPDTVAFRCIDPDCEFGNHPTNPKPPLPVVIIDEDIYDNPPNLIIGTVDKFAMMAWKPEIRSIFGINVDGEDEGFRPSLIIQDELHLISGPLGSMVGLYEMLVEELCVQHVDNKRFRPKIVASTATVSRAEEQVKALYARKSVMMFPPSGLEAGDSFFAKEEIEENGKFKPGKKYVGIMAPANSSMQTTEARVFACLLQYPAVMDVINGDETERDPWWTLLCFFNSLRELGGAETLLVSDVRDYLRVILNRHGYAYSEIRQLLNCEELTSRIRNDLIPMAIQKLEQPFMRDEQGFVRNTVDACLASNLIEVGIDIDRLSLMAIIGQPKTTSQYIQVSGRIGRDMSRPGLVSVIYSPGKPRDRSHYEYFRSYHQGLYSQVEPTSVTPFSPPAVERGLHGVIVGAVRQIGDRHISNIPRPFPLDKNADLRLTIEEMILNRTRFVDEDELDIVKKTFLRRMKEWETWNPQEFGGFAPPGDDPPLVFPAGMSKPVRWNNRGWPMLTSLRNVDASCEAEITAYFNLVDEEDEQ